MTSIEFQRKFYKDEECACLWHYMPMLNNATQKPIPIIAEAACRIQPETLFVSGAGEKLILEIGSGKGAFLVQYAQKFQQNCILGAEWDLYCAKSTVKKLAKLGLKNAAVMRGDLFYFLKDLVPSNSIDEVHMYFPDPWPKRRQQKNRLVLREGFLEQISRVLKFGERFFYWATDHEKYNALALKTFRNFPGAKILEENIALPTYGMETGFEKKYKKEGRLIYRSVICINIAAN